MPERAFVYRFTRDLRLDDHAGLAAAASHGTVVPLLVIDAAMKRRLDVSPKRAAFFCAAVQGLDAELRERGSRLIVRRGEAIKTILQIVREIDAVGVGWSARYDVAAIENDRRLQAELEEAGGFASLVHDAPAVPPEESAELHRGDGPGIVLSRRIFKPGARSQLYRTSIRCCCALPRVTS